MRKAVILSVLAACGGSDTFTIDPLPACTDCGAGHVRGGATAATTVGFAVDGDRVVAFGGQHVEWLGADLTVAASADTGISTDGYPTGPYAGPVVSAPDGHGFAMVSGTKENAPGSTLDIVGLDTAGHPIWTDVVVDGATIPPLAVFLAADGDLTVLVDGSSGLTLNLGGTTYTGWLVIGKLAAADGTLRSAKMYSATRVTVTAATRAPDGGLVIVGNLDGNIVLGGAVGDLKSNMLGRSLFVARLDPAGNGVWAKQWVGAGAVNADSVATDGNRVFAEGTFTTSLDLGGGVVLNGATGVATRFLVALGGDGSYAWSTTAPGNIGYPSIAATPRGVLFGGAYVSATQIGGTPIPATTAAQAGLCAELIDGTAAWVLTAVGNGSHRCTALGIAGGRSYIAVDAVDASGAADTTIDSVSTTGAMRMVLEVGTAPAI